MVYLVKKKIVKHSKMKRGDKKQRGSMKRGIEVKVTRRMIK
jgi:hypothetical protein